MIFLVVVLGSVIYYNRAVSPLVKELAESEIKKKTVDAVVSGALKLKVYEVFYGDFYEYEKNKDGEIVLVRSNTASINAMVHNLSFLDFYFNII